MKKLAVTVVMLLTLVLGSVAAYAASQYSSPAEVVAGLTGSDVQSVINERVQTGKTYGTMANEAGVLSQFQQEMMGMRKDALAAKVKDGTMTPAQADALIDRMETNQANCNGDGIGGGCGFGNGNLGGNGKGHGLNSAGQGMGAGVGKDGAPGLRHGGGGMGHGLRDGSCLNR